jgi:hypothetical protein
MTASRRDRWNLFLCSSTILFVALVCIRWIPAYIRYLGYVTTFVLLSSFLGIGLGILQARRRLDLQTFFPLVLAVLVWIVSTFKLQLTITSRQEVFFQDLAVKVHGTESFFLLPLVFGVVTLLFTLLGQNLGRLLAAVRTPLVAYTIDVAGRSWAARWNISGCRSATIGCCCLWPRRMRSRWSPCTSDAGAPSTSPRRPRHVRRPRGSDQ